jgi:hypothetical protein
MTDRDHRRHRRYYSPFHRAMSMLFALILFACLTGLDLWAAGKVRDNANEQRDAKFQHEQLRERAPQVFRSEILPAANRLAIDMEKAKLGERKALTAEAEALRERLRRVKLAILDNLDRHRQGLAPADAPSALLSPTSATPAPSAQADAAKRARASDRLARSVNEPGGL